MATCERDYNQGIVKEEETIKINGSALKIMSFGGHPPRRIQKTRPATLLVIGTGNPGFPEFYEKFSHVTHTETDFPVWTVGLVGFTSDELSNRDIEEKMTLANQVEMKKELFRRYLKGLNVICIDHSTSCYLTLHLLQSPEFASIIRDAYFLMPVIMKPDTWFLKFIAFLLYYPIASTAKILVSMQDRLPFVIRKNFWKLILRPSYAYCVSKILSRHFYDKWIFLAKELLVVHPMNQTHFQWILNDRAKIHMYISEGDNLAGSWCYYLKRKMPSLDIRLSPKKVGHMFFLEDYLEVSNFLVEWLRETTNSNYN